MTQSGSVRYQKLPGDEQDLDEESDEDRVTVFLPPPSGSSHKRRTWLRVAVAAVLLTVALGFAACEWYGCPSADANQEDRSDLGESQEGPERPRHDGQAVERQSNETKVHGHRGEPGRHAHEHMGSQYHHGVVITDAAVCSEAGREILQDGGNAVDAGMASLLCLGVVHPHTAGVGGVFSGILYNSTTGLSTGIWPVCQGSPLSTYGAPATLQGIRKMHSQFGSSKWEKLFVKAVKLAKEGFPADDTLALALKSNELRINGSEICDLFCDTTGRVKASGAQVINEKLSELLQSISVNESLLPESLAAKLASDLPRAARDDFMQDIRRCGIDFGDPFLVEEEQFTVFVAASSLPVSIMSDMLERSKAQSASSWSNMANYSNLLNTAKLVYNKSLANQSRRGLSASNMVGSHIGVLDNSGNILIISASLNSSFGSVQFLPSSGVILSDFGLDPAAHLSQWSCPSVIKLKRTENDDKDDGEDVLGVGVTGGFSAPFIAAQIIIRLRSGKSVSEAVTGPLLHMEMRKPQSWRPCISVVSNASDVYKLLLEGQDREEAQTMGECPDGTVALAVETRAGHVAAYGAPAARAHADGY